MMRFMDASASIIFSILLALLLVLIFPLFVIYHLVKLIGKIFASRNIPMIQKIVFDERDPVLFDGDGKEIFRWTSRYQVYFDKIYLIEVILSWIPLYEVVKFGYFGCCAFGNNDHYEFRLTKEIKQQIIDISEEHGSFFSMGREVKFDLRYGSGNL